jgi:ABC-type uncharacterized transport system permease subunit
MPAFGANLCITTRMITYEFSGVTMFVVESPIRDSRKGRAPL